MALFGRRDPESYKRRVHAGLDRAYRDAEVEDAQLETLKLIVLSDQHKGTRDGADDFQRCERAYNAALAHYFEHGHRLFTLGDVEELWECDPEEVIASYARTLDLEAEFHRGGRYERFWGNHDDLWREPGQVAKHLGERFEGLAVRETLRIRVKRGAEPLGELFFAHGHQGTLDADRFGWISRLFVRYVWRPLQRKLGMASTAPSVDWRLRGAHDTAMYEWARDHPERIVLVAGHTHRPVFGARAPSPELEESAADLEARLTKLRAAGGDTAELRARLEWRRAEELRVELQAPTPLERPCYFNTGCCSYGDGDITGIELDGNQLRLVRWIRAEGEIAPRNLATDALTGVFSSVGRGGGATA
jgi:hypothetical protein